MLVVRITHTARGACLHTSKKNGIPIIPNKEGKFERKTEENMKENTAGEST
jgi:hypothetical protein